MLLNLPAELVQLVLKHCCTSAYLQAALSCRALYIIASSSRDVILHHMKTNPGPGFRSQSDPKSHDDVERLTTRELFLLLRRGASEHLLYGESDFDCIIYTFDGKVIDISASSMCNKKDGKAIALVFKGDDRIYHCLAGVDGTINIENTQTCSLPVLIPFLNAERVSIIKSTYATDHKHLLGVLVKAEEKGPETEADGLESAPSFFSQELQRERERTQKAYFQLFLEATPRQPIGPGECRTTICEIQADDGFKVNALAAMHHQEFAISWEQTNGNDHNVDIYKACWDAREHYHWPVTQGTSFTSYKSTRFVDEQGLWVAARDPNKIELSHHQEVSTLGAVADLRFNDSRQLLYTHRGSAMFGYYHNLGYQSTTASSFVPTSAHRNYANVRIGESLELSFAVEIPFFATHDTRTLQGTPVCHWRYLSYGISADRVEGFTMACLFISHTAANALRCTHQTNLERGRRLSRWLPVARLCDYPDSSVSTIGCRFAISPNGKRIAVMQWDTLYVWPLNPKEVISFDRSNYYPQSWISGERMDDNDMIELRPVIIRMGAVCFKLMFTENDDIIVGLTDRGLMTWDLRPQARRRRSTVNMDLEHISVLEHEPFVPKEYPEDGSREVAETR
uniref:F-box domain-containing protein n=1 Tax=Talaromyces marneffei PM1 TaxID=1077442 RepID=A0A093UW97_TALMA